MLSALAIAVASFYFMLKILRRAQNDKNKRYNPSTTLRINSKYDPCGNAKKITAIKMIPLFSGISSTI